ncbi:MAG: hypothetical protein HFI69_03780 [Lachnospiraceae bacterium]|nr:hypothetical protein [Lachnospiraceae bacterium]
MDRYEYKLKLEQLKNLVEEKDYEKAAEIADSVNWRKVKSSATLCMVGEIYDRVKRYEDSHEILLMAYDRAAVGRNILYRLTLVALKMGNLDEAKEYYEEFLEVAPYDNQKYILRYQIAKLGGAGIEELITILEEFKDREYIEEWAFELAYLYHRSGNGERCVEVCDELVLWFGDGKYVEKALELKMLYQPLNREQEEKYRQFKQFRDGVVEVRPTDLLESGEIIQETVKIPDIAAGSARFNTSNLQAEIAKSMQQIMDANTKELVSDTMDNIKKMVEEIPYLQVPPEEEVPAPEEEQFGYIETEEEIDGSLKNDFEELLAEDWDGQVRMSVQGGTVQESQVNGQMDIEDVLAEWERTRQAAEVAMATAQERRLVSAKARALQEAQELLKRLNEIIPKLEAGVTPQELLAERYLHHLPFEEEEALLQQTEGTIYPEEGYQPEDAGAMEVSPMEHGVIPEHIPMPEGIEFPEGAQAPLQDMELLQRAQTSPQYEPPEGVELPQGTPMADGMEMPEEMPIPEGTGTPEQSYLPEKAPIAEGMPIPEGTGMPEGMPMPEGIGMPEQSYLPEEAPIAEGMQFPQQASMPQNIQLPEEVPIPEDLRFPEEVPMPEDLRFPEEVPIPEDLRHPEEAPIPEVRHPEEAPMPGNIQLPEEVPMPEDLRHPEEAPMLGNIQLPEEAAVPKDQQPPHRVQAAEKEKGSADIRTAEDISQTGAVSDHISSWEEAARILGEPIPEEYLEQMKRESAGRNAKDLKEAVQERTKVPLQKLPEADEPGIPLEKLIEQEAERGGQEDEKDAGNYLRSVFQAARESREEKVSVPKIELEEPEEHIRKLSKEQREIFSYFVPITGMEQQLCQALEGALHRKGRDNTSSSGNILITGGRGSGKTVLATDFIKAIQKSGGRPGGKVGKITGESLNQKDLPQLLRKIAGGYLIIEKAGDISKKTATGLSLLMEQNTDGLLVIMEDTRKGIDKALSQDVNFARKFTERVRIPVFTSDELVEFAKAYAAEQECEIDDMGILALYNRISNIQKLDEATTLTEVKEILDEAISRAERGGLKKFFGGKKFSPEGYLYLREKDFED